MNQYNVAMKQPGFYPIEPHLTPLCLPVLGFPQSEMMNRIAIVHFSTLHKHLHTMMEKPVLPPPHFLLR